MCPYLKRLPVLLISMDWAGQDLSLFLGREQGQHTVNVTNTFMKDTVGHIFLKHTVQDQHVMILQLLATDKHYNVSHR